MNNNSQSDGSHFLYKQAADTIIKYVRDHELPAGSFLPPIRQLETILGCSVITVKKALQLLRDNNMVTPLGRKGIRIEESIVSSGANSAPLRIGVTVWTGSGISHVGILNTFNEIRKALADRDYEIVNLFIDEEMVRKHDFSALLKVNRLDGLLVCTQEIPEDVISQLQEKNYPVVFANRCGVLPGAWVDGSSAIRKGVGYLIGCGHREIVLVTNMEESFELAKMEKAGFRQAFADYKLDDSIRNRYYSVRTQENESELFRQLLRSENRPTAFIVTDNLMGDRLTALAQSYALSCPEDFSILCIRDYNQPQEWKNLFYSCTKTTGASVIYCCMKILLDIINGTSASMGGICPQEMVIRESIGCLGK